MSERDTGEQLPFGSIVGSSRPLAMAGVIRVEDVFLVVRHEGADVWEPPTTGLRDGERLVEGAARAVLEQAGVEVEPEVNSYMIDVQEHVTHPARPITIGWRFHYFSGEPTPGDGIAEVAWMPRELRSARWPISQMTQDCLWATGDGTRIYVGCHDGVTTETAER